MRKFQDRIETLKFLDPNILHNRFKIPIEDIYEIIIKNWKKFENPTFVGKSIQTEYSPDAMFYEVCDTRYKRGKFIPVDQYDKHILKMKRDPKKDQHISVYQHCFRWTKEAKEKKGVGGNSTMITTPFIWVELDRDSLDEAIQDAWMIAMRFPYPEYMKFYYSGNKSIHIGVDARLFGNPTGWARELAGRGKLFYNLAHKIAGDVRYGNGIADPNFLTREEFDDAYYNTFGEMYEDYGRAKQRLQNTDPALYSTNSLIRTPFSVHEKGNKQKFEVTLRGLAQNDLIPGTTVLPDVLRPYLLDWTFECVEPKENPIARSQFKADGDIVDYVYGKYLPGFSSDDANSQGFVTDLKNPLYDDGKGSCSVNLATGELHDWGIGETYSIAEFLGQMKEIGTKKAERLIINEDKDRI